MGFLLAGVGHKDPLKRGGPNFLIVENKTTLKNVEDPPPNHTNPGLGGGSFGRGGRAGCPGRPSRRGGARGSLPVLARLERPALAAGRPPRSRPQSAVRRSPPTPPRHGCRGGDARAGVRVESEPPLCRSLAGRAAGRVVRNPPGARFPAPVSSLRTPLGRRPG